MLSDPKFIKKEVVDFFKGRGRLEDEGGALERDVLECISECVKEMQNVMLSA